MAFFTLISPSCFSYAGVEHVHAVLPLVALNAGIERIDKAIQKEGLQTSH